MEELDNIDKNLSLLKSYTDKINGTLSDTSQIIYGGPILWENEEQAVFEQNNQEIVNSIRIITQNIHRILKGS